VNKDENLLTRLQNINLCFHFEVEQQVNGVFLNFFGFNGTAGVWRIKALEDSGGWLERTTVEDMDIAVRAHLNGWKFIFLNDVKVYATSSFKYHAFSLFRIRIIFSIFCVYFFTRSFVKFPNPMRLTGSSSTDGTLVLCIYSDCASLISLLQRCVILLRNANIFDTICELFRISAIMSSHIN